MKNCSYKNPRLVKDLSGAFQKNNITEMALKDLVWLGGHKSDDWWQIKCLILKRAL